MDFSLDVWKDETPTISKCKPQAQVHMYEHPFA